MNSSEFEVHQSHNSLVDTENHQLSYLQEIRRIPLAVEDHNHWGQEIASAQRALDGLSRITTLISFDSEQREQVNLLLSDNTCKFLLDQYHLEFASRQKRQRKGGNIDDADLRFLKLYKKKETEINLLLTGTRNKDPSNFPAKLDEYVDGELETVDQGLKAFKNLVVHNLRLILDRALPFEGFGVDLDDLVGFGSEGLMIAAARWDFQKGFEFSTFATRWINQRIGKAVKFHARAIRVPPYALRTFFRLQREKTQQLQIGKEDADLPDFQKSKEDERKYWLVFNARHTVSLNTPVSRHKEDELGDFIPDECFDFEKGMISRMLEERVANAINILPPHEKEVIELRFGFVDGEEKTLVEIGDLLGITRERVRQLESKALGRLARLADCLHLDDFQEEDPKAEKVKVGQLIKVKRKSRRVV